MRFLVYLLLIFPLLFFAPFILAESLSVTLQVGVTEVIFSGFTSPNSQVLLKEDGSVIGTTSSDSSGNWSKTVSVATPNTLHTYAIYSTDSSSRQSATISYNLNATGNTTTTVSNIVIPPTLSLNGTSLFGSGYPNATITTTSSTGDTLTATVNSSGNWSTDLSNLPSGTHTLSATMSVGSYLSLSSTSINFTAPTPTPSPSPASSASSATATSPTPVSSVTSAPQLNSSLAPSPRPFFIRLYDQNQDGKLTRIELFDTIKSWLRKLLVCDLNHDGNCNLTDLSILLYYFER